MEIKQIISHNIDEEIENLSGFCKKAMEYDIISGHNILGFDNINTYERINWILNLLSGIHFDPLKALRIRQFLHAVH